MATNEQDELLNKVLRLYQIWLGEPILGDFWEQVPEAKAALLAWRDNHTKEAARCARIDELKRIRTLAPSGVIDLVEVYSGDLTIRGRVAELSAPQQSKETSNE